MPERSDLLAGLDHPFLAGYRKRSSPPKEVCFNSNTWMYIMSELLRPHDPLRVATPGTDQVHEPFTEQRQAQQAPGPDAEQPQGLTAQPNFDLPPESQRRSAT